MLFEPARSAEPPHSSGITAPSAWSTLPDADRVATPLPASKTGIFSSQPLGSSPLATRSYSAARSGLLSRHCWKDFSHTARAAWPFSSALRVCSMTSSETSKVFSGSKPMTRLVAATSSSPSAEPWAASVFCAFGAGQAMIERIAMKEGRSVTFFASWIAS